MEEVLFALISIPAFGAGMWFSTFRTKRGARQYVDAGETGIERYERHKGGR